jgi:hypothetical protein
MGASTLQLPKSGQSRFSKALPAPPALPPLEFESTLDFSSLAPEKPLPLPERNEPLPPVPPKRTEAEKAKQTTMATIAKPLNSPLPSLPPKFAGPPPRSIPRRPVAAPVTVTPALAPASSPALASPNPPPSPGGSYSSLLSAYDSPRSSSVTSPKGAFDPKSSYSVVSPTLDTQRNGAPSEAPTRDLPSLPSDQNAQKQEHNGNRIPEGDSKELPPPPPLKDAQRSNPRPRTPTGLQTEIAQPSTSAITGSPLGNGSPQQEQLWRRRSLKADKSLAVPDLKLVSSHGSTAASAQNTEQGGSDLFSQPFPLPPRSNPETLEPATTQRAPPRTTNGGLPGRDIRPAAGRETASQGEASMGQEVSRLKEKLGHGRQQGSRGGTEIEEPGSAGIPEDAQSRDICGRLPSLGYPSSHARVWNQRCQEPTAGRGRFAIISGIIARAPWRDKADIPESYRGYRGAVAPCQEQPISSTGTGQYGTERALADGSPNVSAAWCAEADRAPRGSRGRPKPGHKPDPVPASILNAKPEPERNPAPVYCLLSTGGAGTDEPKTVHPVLPAGRPKRWPRFSPVPNATTQGRRRRARFARGPAPGAITSRSSPVHHHHATTAPMAAKPQPRSHPAHHLRNRLRRDRQTLPPAKPRKPHPPPPTTLPP